MDAPRLDHYIVEACKHAGKLHEFGMGSVAYSNAQSRFAHKQFRISNTNSELFQIGDLVVFYDHTATGKHFFARVDNMTDAVYCAAVKDFDILRD